MSEKSIFDRLYAVDLSGKIETKNDLSYVSWAYAWAEIKKAAPDATYTIYERDTQYGPVNYFTDGRTCWVKTGLTIAGLEHIEYLPVMDFRNNSIPLANIKSTDVNKAIQRSLTKAAARHGLGLYVYAGEDLPEDAAKELKKEAERLKAEEMEKVIASAEPVPDAGVSFAEEAAKAGKRKVTMEVSGSVPAVPDF